LGRGMGSQLIGGSLLFLLEKVAVEYKVCWNGKSSLWIIKVNWTWAYSQCISFVWGNINFLKKLSKTKENQRRRSRELGNVKSLWISKKKGLVWVCISAFEDSLVVWERIIPSQGTTS
jgi:hypothetical protein